MSAPAGFRQGVALDNELADLRMQPGELSFRIEVGTNGTGLASENSCHLFNRLPLPRQDQIGVQLVVGRKFIQRSLPADRLQCDLCLELGRKMPSGLHVSSVSRPLRAPMRSDPSRRSGPQRSRVWLMLIVEPDIALTRHLSLCTAARWVIARQTCERWEFVATEQTHDSGAELGEERRPCVASSDALFIDRGIQKSYLHTDATRPARRAGRPS
jgi:hypothetical protein